MKPEFGVPVPGVVGLVAALSLFAGCFQATDKIVSTPASGSTQGASSSGGTGGTTGSDCAPFVYDSLNLGLSGSHTATGDMDHDGVPDLVFSELDIPSTYRMAILHGLGDGGFTRLASDRYAGSISGMAVVDLDGDGFPDVVATNESDATSLDQQLLVFMNAGDGTLRAPVVASSTDQCAGDVVVGDFNGDGKPDVASINGSCAVVQVFLGQGDGGLVSGATAGVPMWTSGGVAGDFNGDGKLDLAVAEYQNAPGAMVLLGDGHGGFTDGGQYATGAGARAVAAADFNGDGILDLATANWIDYTVSLLLGSGNGQLVPAGTWPVGHGGEPSGIVAVDLNGDGKPDLAVTTSGYHSGSVLCTYSVLLGDGRGSFATPLEFGVDECPADLVAVDLNRDGRLDLAAANFVAYTASILFSTDCPLTPSSPTQTDGGLVGNTGTSTSGGSTGG
ncbi:MAG: VCBS repeat-containing protein [Deltaproteobacteria bacterium]|nr:VCBS repeat-containing protein [Deltaproteobacteria bacterium]